MQRHQKFDKNVIIKEPQQVKYFFYILSIYFAGERKRDKSNLVSKLIHNRIGNILLEMKSTKVKVCCSAFVYSVHDRIVSVNRMAFLRFTNIECDTLVFGYLNVLAYHFVCSLSRVDGWQICGRQEMDLKWMRETNINNYPNVKTWSRLSSLPVRALPSPLIVFPFSAKMAIEFYNTYTTCNICS